MFIVIKKDDRHMEYFKTLPDARIDRKKLHKLLDIIFITIAAVICGANDWEDIEEKCFS